MSGFIVNDFFLMVRSDLEGMVREDVCPAVYDRVKVLDTCIKNYVLPGVIDEMYNL